MTKKLYILGGGTNSFISNHLSLAAPAYGQTAKKLYEKFSSHLDNQMQTEIILTKMAIPLEERWDLLLSSGQILTESTNNFKFNNCLKICSYGNGPINIERYQTITLGTLIWWGESYGKWYENFIDRALDEIYPDVSDLTESQFNQAFEYQLIKLKEEILDKGYLYYNFDW